MAESNEESNKVVFKINYHNNKNRTQPKMVVEWNIKRILLAVALLIVLIAAIVYLLSSDTSDFEKTETVDDQNKQSLNQSVDGIIKPVKEMDLVSENQADSKVLNDDRISDVTTTNNNAKQTTVNNSKLIDNKISKQNKAVATVFKDSHIVRALLTSALNNKEPVDIMTIPIRVNKEGARSVTYFTEIINMKGKVLYHQWLRNNKVIFKRKISIFGNRWRAATSKLIIYSQVGIWNVRLVDEKGIVLNAIQFDVIQGASD